MKEYFYKSIMNILFVCLVLIPKGIISQINDLDQINYSDDIVWDKPEWENPEIFQINREEPTATFYSYKSSSKALVNDDWKNSSYYKSLNGNWHFNSRDSTSGLPKI